MKDDKQNSYMVFTNLDEELLAKYGVEYDKVFEERYRAFKQASAAGDMLSTMLNTEANADVKYDFEGDPIADDDPIVTVGYALTVDFPSKYPCQ